MRVVRLERESTTVTFDGVFKISGETMATKVNGRRSLGSAASCWLRSTKTSAESYRFDRHFDPISCAEGQSRGLTALRGLCHQANEF
jgi:hypothetical protein